MIRNKRDIYGHKRDIIGGCVILYLVIAVCIFYWLSDYEMPYRLRTLMLFFGIFEPTYILAKLMLIFKEIDRYRAEAAWKDCGD